MNTHTSLLQPASDCSIACALARAANPTVFTSHILLFARRSAPTSDEDSVDHPAARQRLAEGHEATTDQKRAAHEPRAAHDHMPGSISSPYSQMAGMPGVMPPHAYPPPPYDPMHPTAYHPSMAGVTAGRRREDGSFHQLPQVNNSGQQYVHAPVGYFPAMTSPLGYATPGYPNGYMLPGFLPGYPPAGYPPPPYPPHVPLQPLHPLHMRMHPQHAMPPGMVHAMPMHARAPGHPPLAPRTSSGVEPSRNVEPSLAGFSGPSPSLRTCAMADGYDGYAGAYGGGYPMNANDWMRHAWAQPAAVPAAPPAPSAAVMPLSSAALATHLVPPHAPSEGAFQAQHAQPCMLHAHPFHAPAAAPSAPPSAAPAAAPAIAAPPSELVKPRGKDTTPPRSPPSCATAPKPAGKAISTYDPEADWRQKVNPWSKASQAAKAGKTTTWKTWISMAGPGLGREDKGNKPYVVWNEPIVLHDFTK